MMRKIHSLPLTNCGDVMSGITLRVGRSRSHANPTQIDPLSCWPRGWKPENPLWISQVLHHKSLSPGDRRASSALVRPFPSDSSTGIGPFLIRSASVSPPASSMTQPYTPNMPRWGVCGHANREIRTPTSCEAEAYATGCRRPWRRPRHTSFEGRATSKPGSRGWRQARDANCGCCRERRR